MWEVNTKMVGPTRKTNSSAVVNTVEAAAMLAAIAFHNTVLRKSLLYACVVNTTSPRMARLCSSLLGALHPA